MHPVATGVGATVGGVAGGVAGGAAAGAAVGGLTGPVGAALGAAAGALAGKGVGKAINPEAEDAYWRENYASRPYVEGSGSYDDYGPAYKYGVETFSLNSDRSFDDVEGDLSRNWETARGRSSLEWDDAKHATRDAWNRLSNTVLCGGSQMDSAELVGVPAKFIGRWSEEFATVDRDRDGRIDFKEFRALVDTLIGYLPDNMLKVGFGRIDADHDGRIALGEFVAWRFESLCH